jgi:SEC-C motif-containing protein
MNRNQAFLWLLAAIHAADGLLAPPVPGCSLTNCRAKSGGFGATTPKAPSKKTKAKTFTKKQAQLEADRITNAPARCPCHSGLDYKACCAPCHAQEARAATPEALLRSRYAAFSLELPSYLAATTHPLHDDFDKDTAAWVQRLAKGLDASYFEGLRVLAQESLGENEHEITFEADVRPRDSPEGAGVTLHERSRFMREDGVWFYREGLDVSSKKR